MKRLVPDTRHPEILLGELKRMHLVPRFAKLPVAVKLSEDEIVVEFETDAQSEIVGVEG